MTSQFLFPVPVFNKKTKWMNSLKAFNDPEFRGENKNLSLKTLIKRLLCAGNGAKYEDQRLKPRSQGLLKVLLEGEDNFFFFL